MKRFFLITLGAVIFSACEIGLKDAAEPKDAIRLADIPLIVTQNKLSPQFNEINYAQSEKPHRQIERDFVFQSGTDVGYQLDQYSFTTGSCRQGRSQFTMVLVRGRSVGKIADERPFVASSGDRLKIVLENIAECQTLNLRFVIVPTP